MEDKINQQRKRVAGGIKPIVWITILVVGIGYLYICLNFVQGVVRYLDRDFYTRNHMYKVGETDPEYITYEHLYDYKFKVSFHNKKDNPGTDYIILTSHYFGEEIPLQWSYFGSRNNTIFIEHEGIDWFTIDTVVSRHYDIHLDYKFVKGNERLTHEEKARAKEISDSLLRQPYNLFVYPKYFNNLGYTHSQGRWDRVSSNDQEAKVVRIGK